MSQRKPQGKVVSSLMLHRRIAALVAMALGGSSPPALERRTFIKRGQPAASVFARRGLRLR